MCSLEQPPIRQTRTYLCFVALKRARRKTRRSGCHGNGTSKLLFGAKKNQYASSSGNVALSVRVCEREGGECRCVSDVYLESFRQNKQKQRYGDTRRTAASPYATSQVGISHASTHITDTRVRWAGTEPQSVARPNHKLTDGGFKARERSSGESRQNEI